MNFIDKINNDSLMMNCRILEKKTHWTLRYCILKFGWNIDLQPKISTQLKRSDYEKKIPIVEN